MAISMKMVKQRRLKKKLAILSASQSTDTEVNFDHETDPMNKDENFKTALFSNWGSIFACWGSGPYCI